MKKIKWIIYFLFVLTILLGIFLSLRGYISYDQALESQTWPNVEGIVIQSETVKYKRGVNFFKVRIMIEYFVGEKQFFVQKESFNEFQSEQTLGIQQIISKYPEGKAVKIYYNPNNPAIALIEPGQTNRGYLTLITGLFLVCFGVLGLWFYKTLFTLQKIKQGGLISKSVSLPIIM